MKNRDLMVYIGGTALLVCLGFSSASSLKNSLQIRELKKENESLKEQQELVQTAYEEQIVMLDSQTTLLEAELLELREEVNSLKK